LTFLVGTDAEDLASETWSQVCRDLHGFRGDIDGFRGWVTTIGRHRALDHLRSEKRHPAVHTPLLAALDSPAPSDTEGEALSGIETQHALGIIAQLPPDQAEAVLLRAVVGLDAKRAASILGKRPGAVRTAAYRGLSTLAQRLSAESQDSV
jgi:RNA polymerase sigma-70 factor (ECF subfamily)